MNAHAPVTSSSPAARPSSPRAFRWRDVVDVVERHQGRILLTTAVVVGLAALYVATARPQFAATSEVMIDPRKSSVETSAAVLSNLTVDQPTILNQIEILTSHRFAGEVVDRLHLDTDPEFASPGIADRLFGTGNDAREIAVTKLRNRLKVAQAGFSSSIRITVTSPDRDKASKVVAGIARLYVDEQLDTKSAAARQARTWLTQRVGELARQVRDAEAAVQKYKADHGISITADGTSILEKQVADLNTQLTVARTDYDDKAAKAGQTDSLLRGNQLATAPQVVASPLITTLRTQQSEIARQMANLATRYGPNHPKMAELAAQRTDIQNKIAEESARIAISVRNEAESSRTHVASLEKSLRHIEEVSAEKNQEAVELAGLQSAASSARALYSAFLTQYSQTENQQGILRADASVISASEVVDTFGPQTKLLAILSAIPAGLLLGLALAFMAERGEAAPKPAPRRETAGGYAPALQPATAALPEILPGQRGADPMDPRAPYALAVNALLGTVLGRVAPPATIVISSAAPGAGKTTLSLALARAAAKSGVRTMLIDANYPHLRLSDLLGGSFAAGDWPAGVPGGIDSFIQKDPRSPALMMAASALRPGYAELLAPAALDRLIAGFKQSFDLVILIAPPMGDPLARALYALGDAALVAIDARAPLPAGPLPQGALTVFTHARMNSPSARPV